MNLQRLYSEFQKLNPNDPRKTNSFFDRIPSSVKNLKSEIHDIVKEAIVYEDKSQLVFALNLAYKAGIDNTYIELIAQLLTATWHDEHEDLVSVIYLENLNDNIFTDALYKIATEPELYRKYDDEMESTLRKCIHALKMIDSEDANTYIVKLKNTNNSNVDMALSIYKK
jgi:HEAT repeat protein